MENKDFVTTQETTAKDFLLQTQEGDSSEKMCFVPPVEKVYQPISEYTKAQAELPVCISNIYNNKLSEINNGVFNVISSYQDAYAIDKQFDDMMEENKKNAAYSTITEIVERGLPSSIAVELYNTQKAYRQAYGAGIYEALSESRIVDQAADNNIAQACYVDSNNNISKFMESSIHTYSNYQALDDMATKAENDYSGYGLAEKVAKGWAGVIPFNQNWGEARKFKNVIKQYLGDAPEVKEIGDSWNFNKVMEAGRKALMRAATGDTNRFKQLLNDMDGELSSNDFTMGERATFWRQIRDTTIALNRFAFGAEVVGLVPIAKSATQSAKVTAAMTGKLSAGVARGALEAGVMSTGGDILMGAYKTATKPFGLLRLIGQNERASKLMENLLSLPAAERTINPDTTSRAIKTASKEWLENGMESGFSPNALKTSTAISTDKSIVLSDALEGVEDIEDATKSIALAQGMSGGMLKDVEADAKSAAVSAFKERLEKNMANYEIPVKNINVVSDDSGFYMQTLLGAGDRYNKPFTSVEAAQKFADSLNEKGLYEGFSFVDKARVFQNQNGAYVQITRRINNGDKTAYLGDLVADSIKKSKLVGKDANKEFSKSWLARWFLGASSTADITTKGLSAAKQADEGRIFRLFYPYFKAVKDVKVGHGVILDALRAETAKNGRYFTVSALKQAGIPEDVINGYRALKIMGDASYLTRMKGAVDGMKANNVKNIYFGKDRIGLGMLVDRPDRQNVKFVTGMKKDEAGNLVPDYVERRLQDLKDEDVHFVKLTYGLDGDNTVAISTTAFNSKEPSAIDGMFSYKPGRELFTQNSGFVKQVRTSTITGADGKQKKIDVGINTVFAHPSAARTEEAAKVLEAFRQEAIKVSKGKSLTAAQIDIQKIDGWEKVGDFEEFYKLTQGKNPVISLNPDDKLIFARDGERIVFDNGTQEVKDFNFRGMSAIQYTNSERVLRGKKRSDLDIFNPFNFGEAPRLNAMQEMSVAAENMTRFSTVDDYTKMYAENFKSSFIDYLKGYENRSSADLLLRFNPNDHKSQIPPKVINQMINAQENYKRIMSTSSSFDEWVSNIATDLADKLVPEWKTAGRNKYAFYNWLSNANPVRKSKAFTFNWFLSMYNVRQLWTQAAASFNAINMNPKVGGYAALYHFPIIAYMNSNDKSIFRKAVEKFGVGKASELEEVANIAKRLDVYTQAAPAGAFELGVKEAALSGTSWWDPTAFYLKGEYANRTLTAIMAAKEAYDKGFRASTMKAADFINLNNTMQKYYLHMGREGTAWTQTGLQGFFTQFRGYQFRFLEAMLGKELTFGEKSRLFMGQLMMGGAKGLVGSKYAPKLFASFTDRNKEVTPATQIMYHGLVDYMAMQLGANKSFGEAWSVGLGDILSNVLDAPLSELPASTGMFSKATGLISEVANEISMYMKLDPDERRFSSFLNGALQRISGKKLAPGGLSNPLIAYYALTTGRYLDYNGQLSAETRSTLDALLSAAGFKNISDDEFVRMFAEKNKFETDDAEQEKYARELFNYAAHSPSKEVMDMRLQEVRNTLSAIGTDNPELAYKIERKLFSLKNLNAEDTNKLIRMIDTLAPSTKRFRDYSNKAYEEAKKRTQQTEQ